MTPDQVVDLLTLIQARDNRQVGQTTVLAWHEDLEDLDFDDCREAVRRHFRTSIEWLMPAHVRQLVRAIRDERLANSDLVLPGADPASEADYRESLRQIRQRLGDGQPPPFRAIPAAGHSEPTGEYRETRDDLAAKRKARLLAAARDLDPSDVSWGGAS